MIGDATGAIAESQETPKPLNQLVSGSDSVFEETVAEKKPTSVMAT